MPVTRYSCPLPTCSWALDHAAADAPDLKVARAAEGHLVLREDFLASIAYRASHRSLLAAEDAIGEHLDTHTAGDWMKAFIVARTEAAEARTINARAEVVDGAWGSVWLHGAWGYITAQMDTEQREHAAAAVLRWMHGLDAVDGRTPRDEPEGLRWWNEAPVAASSPYTGGPTRPRTATGTTPDETGPGHGK